MSTFTTPADLRLLPNFKWEVISPFEYHVGTFPSREVIVVPIGTITDLTSVPRAFWSVYPPNGPYAKAAILHDYLYQNAIGSKEWADNIFLEAMEVLKISKTTRTILYNAVKLFGRGSYR